MICLLVLIIAMGSLGWSQSQSVVARKTFLHEVEALQARTRDTQPIDSLLRLQQEIGLSAASAKGVFEVVGAYNSGADKVESTMKRSIFTRRLQIAGEFRVTYSPELDLVNWANLDLNLLLFEQLDDLRSRIGEDEYGKLAKFIDDHSAGPFFPLLEGETGPTWQSVGEGWKRSPAAFWREYIEGPLSGPQAEDLFLQNYKDALLPIPAIVPYLEGTVVSVTSEDSTERKVLFSMDGDGSAKLALLIDGVVWKLKSEPEKGATVRFTGTVREFSQEPFLILLEPERIEGLSLESTQRNLPFTTLGLAR
ncbi:MAG: hypothetical protein ABI811_23705 [Acidobacteriota bacterium]